MNKLWLSSVLIILVVFACSPAGKNKGSNESASARLSDVHLMAYQEYKKAEEELAKLYNQFLDEYSDDPLFKARLEKAELAWIDFRDAQLEFLFPEANAGILSEESASVQYWLSMKELTEEYILQLRMRLLELNRVGSAGED